ncbi:hypothetical protein EJ04DRAFT_578488 [Polyplosphaeria fusca]|uniref:Uncharacterized protein n=1 Tax=Polyplosphaeria fusca TaxID=682080 RepID=A0A9P4QWK0_9PLEO|nr:hypothetical protein EJ04DRAFT_578488 [Polyplosphaeria fusca]
MRLFVGFTATFAQDQEPKTSAHTLKLHSSNFSAFSHAVSALNLLELECYCDIFPDPDQPPYLRVAPPRLARKLSSQPSDTMSSDANVATTALVVAAVALLIAVGQFLQQIFGTADGYRRCQESVMGPWASYTRLSWRWKGFRFETKFTTPSLLFIAHDSSGQDVQGLYRLVDCKGRGGNTPTDNSKVPVALRETLRQSDPIRNPSRSDFVTWMSLLRSISEIDSSLMRGGVLADDVEGIRDAHVDEQFDYSLAPIQKSRRLYAAVRLEERSWDLIPPDIVRPFAKTTLGHLITIASRLGMHWIDFEPTRGALTAQGNGHSISSTTVRGLGMLIDYRRSVRHRIMDRAWYIAPKVSPNPTREFQMFACGLIPPSLFLASTISLSDKSAYSSAIEYFLSQMRVDRKHRRILVERVNQPVSHGPGDALSLVLSEAIGVLAPFIPAENDGALQWPSLRRWVFCATDYWEGKAALLAKLRVRAAVHPHPTLRHILEKLTMYQQEFPDDFYNRLELAARCGNAKNGMKQALLTFCRDEHDWASRTLWQSTVELCQQSTGVMPGEYQVRGKLMDVLSWHLNTAVESLQAVTNAPYPGRDYDFVNDKNRGTYIDKLMIELGLRYVEAVGQESFQFESSKTTSIPRPYRYQYP